MTDAVAGKVRQLRLVVHAEDYDEALRFYRDVLGMPEQRGEDGQHPAVVVLGAVQAELAEDVGDVALDRLDG